MLPALINPNISCITPARKTLSRNTWNEPSVAIAVKTMAVSPAAGPDTLMLELLIKPTIIPPITPAIMPANGGAFEASAIPRQRGNATKNTTSPDGKSDLRLLKKAVFFIMT